MTCIAALIHNERVYIGGDSAGVDTSFGLTVRADRKVFKKGDMVFGFAGSYRMGNLLQHSLEIPRHHPDDEPHKYMVNEFIPAVRSLLKEGGVSVGSEEVVEGVDGDFIVGYRGHMFVIYGDYQVAESTDDYIAVGCGTDIALGSLGSTKGDPKARILKALDLAVRHSAGVRGPFHVEVSP